MVGLLAVLVAVVVSRAAVSLAWAMASSVGIDSGGSSSWLAIWSGGIPASRSASATAYMTGRRRRGGPSVGVTSGTVWGLRSAAHR